VIRRNNLPTLPPATRHHVRDHPHSNPQRLSGERGEESDHRRPDLWVQYVQMATVTLCYAQLTRRPEHIKNLLESARQPATDGYTRLIQSLHNDSNVSGHIHKSGNGTSTTSRTTYLCLQCPAVSGSGERHRKEHAFCEYIGRDTPVEGT
jgi:hypothetical protein